MILTRQILDKIEDFNCPEMNVLVFTSVLIALGLDLVLVDSCSMMTHIEIGERIRHFLDLNSQGVDYKALIDKHPDAYQAGCPYPDAYYPSFCFGGDYHDVAEDTHWVPFLNASINYIRTAYPRPWNETAEKLVVFLMGIVAHQVADINWHSLGIDQGFLRAMANVNYHGSFGDAHTAGDFGGDVVNLYELNMDYIPLVDTWYVPTQDLLNIYETLYGTRDRMLAEVVNNCTTLLFLGRLGENLGVIEYLYANYAAQSPFLVDRLNDYYLGGVDDMAVWSGNVFAETVLMLDQGTQVCTLPHEAIYIDCNVTTKTDHRKTLKSELSPRIAPSRRRRAVNPGIDTEGLEMALALVDQSDFKMEYVDHGIVYSASKSYKKRLHRKMRREKQFRNRRRNKTKYSNVITPDVLYTTQFHYSRLGESLLVGDINNDGDLDLVMGAPGFGTDGNYQQGRVYIVYGSASGLPVANLTVELQADLILQGSQLNGRFGSSLALVDLNADGYGDLAVGAPAVGSDSLNYFGQVYVYFGTDGGISTSPDVTISCTERYCSLGRSLTSGDVNHDGYSDLVVGAPHAPAGGEQRGFVGVLYASSAISGGQLTELDLNWRQNGDQDYEWFGYSVTTGSTTSISGILAVGSPTYRLCAQPGCGYDQADVQSVGRVTTFNTPLSADPGDYVAGNVSLAQLGFNVKATSEPDQPLFGMTATTRDFPDIDPSENDTTAIQLGHVSIYDWSDPSWSYYFSVVGDREFGRLGNDIEFTDVNGDQIDDVIISAPLRSETIADGREEGRLFIFYSSESRRGNVYVANEADLTLGLGEEKARYGYSVAPLRTNSGQLQLAVSAPHSNARARLSGAVGLHNL